MGIAGHSCHFKSGILIVDREVVIGKWTIWDADKVVDVVSPDTFKWDKWRMQRITDKIHFLTKFGGKKWKIKMWDMYRDKVR